MQTKYTYKEIWLIAYPILISLLMEQMIGMTDTAFLGRVGEIELGASAIAGIFYIVMFMVAFGFSIGAQILIARRNGEQQYKEIGNLFYQGIYFQLGMAAVMFIVCYCFAPVILKRLVSSEHGIQELSDLTGTDLTSLANRIRALKKADGRYDNYGGICEGASGSVRFIIETDEIKAE